jgi:flagella basal body P-ring formation protein FlgA
VAVALRAGRADSIWVASRPLLAGTIVRQDDLARAPQLLYGPPTETATPLGWEVRRNVATGEPLVAPVVSEPVLIKPGDPVRFAWDQGPIRIVREGISQTSARRGQPVWARDPLRGERLRGIATGHGQAILVGGGAR